MKRRSVSRRPVLDLQTEQSSKISASGWANKASMGPPASAKNEGGALAGLLGDYGSDSNSEDDGDSAAPVIPVDSGTHAQLPMWSMCVDPSSGFPYYWEQITNTVSWEPPPGLALTLPSPVAVAGKAATVPKIAPPTPQATKKQEPPPEDSSSEEEVERIELITSYYNSDSGSEDDEAKRNSVVRVYPPNSKPKTKEILMKPSNKVPDKSKTFGLKVTKSFGPELPKTFGPELPKIIGPELQNAFGPKLSNESESPKTNVPHAIIGPTLAENSEHSHIFGPELPKSGDLSDMPETPAFVESNVATELPETFEICEEIQPVLQEDVIQRHVKESSIEKLSEFEIIEDTIISQNKTEFLPDETEDNGVDTVVAQISQEKNTKIDDGIVNTEISVDNKCMDELETDNLEDLIEVKSKLLKKLGELVPSEIKYLVGSSGSGCQSPVKSPRTPPGTPPPSSPPPAKSHTALDMDVDDLIAQIEKEQPIDQPMISSDASETVCSTESTSNKSSLTTEETSQPKPDILPFKPLFPSVKNIDDAPLTGVLQDHVKLDAFQDNVQIKLSDDVTVAQSTNANENIDKKLHTVESTMEKLPENKIFNKYELDPSESGIENAAFKRKRRIALDVLPSKRQAPNEDLTPAGTSDSSAKRDLSYTTKYAQNFETCGERMGLGFQPDLNERDFSSKKNIYSIFKKGNIMFHKGETLVPLVSENENEKLETNDAVDDTMDDKKALIEAKLNFLTQSLPPVPPLQQLYIELQTLWAVAKSDGVLPYLSSWLDTAGAELSRLEQNAAPAQWTCRFSSESGCYVYEHEPTGQQQWHYPAVATTGIEDMDICTTPPPPPPDEPPPPPPPPPPPLPIISRVLSEPLPPGTVSPPLPEEPLCPPPPPSITSMDLQRTHQLQNPSAPPPPTLEPPLPPQPPDDALCAALDSFYSDLADLETVPPAPVCAPVPPPPPSITPLPVPKPVVTPVVTVDTVQDKMKKKKSKTKMSSTISLKNRGVSSMVEKWKKVQESLDDQ